METLKDLNLVRAMDTPVGVMDPESGPDVGDDVADADEILGTMEGHFSVWDQWYEIHSWWEGDFLERTARGAFRKTMAERRKRIVCTFDHGYDPSIGDKVLGPIVDLREDNIGAYYAVDLMSTSYCEDLFPGIKRGLYGSSFRFQVIREEWNDEPGVSDWNPKGLPERTITEVRLIEFGPVTYPASPEATAGIRSLTDQWHERAARVDPAGVAAMRSRVTDLRTRRTPGAAPQGTPGLRAALHDGSTPPDGTWVGYGPRERRSLLHPEILRSAS